MKYLKITNITDSLNKKDKNFNKIFDINIGGTNIKLFPKLDAIVSTPSIGAELRRMSIEKLLIFSPVSKNDYLKYERLQKERVKTDLDSFNNPKKTVKKSTKVGNSKPTQNKS